jgi:N4-gp56 family major capsid protein
MFAVFQGTPRANAGGESLNYKDVSRNIPVIGDNTGEANVVSFNTFTVNGTIMTMGRMFKLTESLLMFSDYGAYGNGQNGGMLGGPNINPENVKIKGGPLTLMLEGFYDQISRDKEIAQQLDIINGAGVTFYAGGALTKKGITKPLTVDTLKQCAARLTLNGAEHDTDNFGGSQNYGSTYLGESWWALTSPEGIQTLKEIQSNQVNGKIDTWQPAASYAAAGLRPSSSSLASEKGSLGDFRFVQMYPETAITYQGGGGKPGRDVWFNSEYKTTTEANKEGYNKKIVDEFALDANGNLDLHMIYVIGKNAISTIKLKGRGTMQVNSHVPGTGKNVTSWDPYDQNGFVSAKWIHGSFVRHPDKIAKIIFPVRKF